MKNAYECVIPHPIQFSIPLSVVVSVYDTTGALLISKFNPRYNHRPIFGSARVYSLALDDEIYREA